MSVHECARFCPLTNGSEVFELFLSALFFAGSNARTIKSRWTTQRSVATLLPNVCLHGVAVLFCFVLFCFVLFFFLLHLYLVFSPSPLIPHSRRLRPHVRGHRHPSFEWHRQCAPPLQRLSLAARVVGAAAPRGFYSTHGTSPLAGFACLISYL
jgi:hypothetical protein